MAQPYLIHSVRRCIGFCHFVLGFACMTFVLANSPYYFSDFQIGLFGLLGVIGIFSSSVSGKTVGKGRENFVTILFIGLRLFACIPLFLHSRILWLMLSVC